MVAGLFRLEARRRMRLRPSAGIAAAPAEPVFLYVHVPFCEVLCPYCSFHRVRYQDGKAHRYFAALRREIRHYHERGYRFGGVYVGGGTPTVLPDELVATIGLVRELNPGLGDVSVETNPKDLRDEVLGPLAGAGVGRLSVGVQSFDDGMLARMGRLEKYGDRAEILARLGAAAGRFRTLNVDMMWNLPNQTEAMLEADLESVLGSPANQASFYPLMQTRSAARQMARTMGVPARGRLQRRLPADPRAPQARVHADLRLVLQPRSRAASTSTSWTTATTSVSAAAPSATSAAPCTRPRSRSTATWTASSAAAAGVTGERRLGVHERLQYDVLVRLFGLRLERDWVRARYGARLERLLAAELLLAPPARRGHRRPGRLVADRARHVPVGADDVGVLRGGERVPRADAPPDPCRARGSDRQGLGEALVPLAEIRHGPGELRRAR